MVKKPPPGLDDLKGPTKEDFRQHHADEFEDQIVAVLCRHYGVPTIVRERMRTANQDWIGEKVLTFIQWYDFYPEFPMYFGSTVIPHLPKDATVSKLFTSFGTRKFIEEYEVLLESAPTPDSCPTGLIFKWPYLAGPGSPPTGLVLHNRSFNEGVAGVRITWISPDTKSRLTIEPLTILLTTLDVETPGKPWMEIHDE